MTTETTATPTPLDVQWLQEQISAALAAAGAAPTARIDLPRATVELVACVLHTHAPPARASRYNWDSAALRPAVLAELRRLANDGEAPSKRRWDAERPPDLPTAQHICRILATRWQTLALAAGLRLNHWARRIVERDPAGAPAGDMDDADDQPPILQREDYDDLVTVGERTEIRTVGNIQTTRTYYLLR